MERETVLGWSDLTNLCEITTFNRALINKLAKLSKKHPDTYKLENEGVVDGSPYVEYIFPKRLVSLRAPNSRKMTEEQKKAASERMKEVKAKEKKEKKSKKNKEVKTK
jgi:hypothetical protein